MLISSLRISSSSLFRFTKKFVFALLAPALFDFFLSPILCWNSLTCSVLGILEKVVPPGSDHCYGLCLNFSLLPANQLIMISIFVTLGTGS